MFLVRDILEEIANHVGGHGVDIDCSDESQNVALKVLNESQRLIMAEGDFEGSEQEICLTVTNSCVTLDRRIETIKQYTINNQPGQVLSDNFKFLQQGWGSLDKNDNCSCGSALEDVGDVYPLINDLEKAMYITAYSDRPETGATLEIYGDDATGREISRHWETDKGFTIPIQERGAERPAYTGDDSRSSGKVRHIRALRKPRTKGYVYVYGYLPHVDEDTGLVDCYESKWLVTLAPDETNPQHRRYKVPGASCEKTYDMAAKVSMRWYRQYPGDVALIQNPDAMILMARALNARDDNELGLYDEYFARALDRLYKQRGKKHPASQNFFNVRMARNPIRNSSTRYRKGGGYY
jgi:hypothetical protein